MSPISTPLNEVRINSALNSAYWRVKVVNETGSTQIDLATAINESRASNGDVIVAEFQSHGRGRLDRSFIAQSGTALLFSLFVSPNQKVGEEQWGWLPLLASQAVLRTLEAFISKSEGVNLKLKWPNDILLNEKKIAGLLCERVNQAEKVGVIVGIGINISATKEEMPVVGATSLLIEGFPNLDRNDILVGILQNFTNYLRRWEEGDQSLLPEYIDASATIGRRVRIEMPANMIQDTRAVNIAPSGALLLEDGSLISVGDIVHLRPE